MTEDGKKEITNKPEVTNDQVASAASAVVQEEKPAVKVEKDELWIKVQYRSNLIITDKDGKVVFSRIVPAGSEQRLRGGAPYNVWIGIAAGSEANYGGTPIEPLKYRVAGENPPLLLQEKTKMTTPKRRQTHQVKIDHLIIGSDAPVLVQSMTTDTADAAATARQVKELSDAGSEMVRITVNTPEAASKVAKSAAA